MSSSSSSDASGSSDAEEEQQAVQQVVTGANADPQVLQYFWDLASLQQVSSDHLLPCSDICVWCAGPSFPSVRWFVCLEISRLTRSLPPCPCCQTQEERQAAAEALVAALVDSQKQYDGTHRTKGAVPSGNFDQEAGNRQQRMEQCLSCCSPLMVRSSTWGKGRRATTCAPPLAQSVQGQLVSATHGCDVAFSPDRLSPPFLLCVTWQQAYGLKRLARGLASSRQGARQGFAAALAATLAHSAAAASKGAATAQKLQQPFVSAAGVLAVLDACLEVTGSMKGTVRLMSTVLCAGGCAGCSCGWPGQMASGLSMGKFRCCLPACKAPISTSARLTNPRLGFAGVPE